MNFTECCSTCIGNTELVGEFNRLTGYKLGKPRNGITKAIDAACNYDPDKEAFPAFANFVYDYIWLPLVERERS